jgi:adenylate kinase family enzyme
MSEIFKGFCFDEKGIHTPAVVLNDVPSIIRYCALQSVFFHEVRITDVLEEDTVFQVIKGIVVWPEEMKDKPIKEVLERLKAYEAQEKQNKEQYEEYQKGILDPRD